MSALALLAFGLLAQPDSTPDRDPPGWGPVSIQDERFDPDLVEELMRAYRELGPVEAPPLGGGRPLPLDRVIASTEAHHPNLREATAELRSAEGQRLAARGGFDPKLSVKGGAVPQGYYDVDAIETKLAQPTPLWGTEFFAGYRVEESTNIATYDDRETLDGGEVKGGFRIPVLLDGPIDARRAGVRTAQLGVEAAEASRELTRLELNLGATEAYWNWVAAGEGLRVALELVRLAERRGDQIEVQVSEGAAPQIYRAENLRSLLKRRDKLVESTRKLEKAAIKLSLFFRDDDGAPVAPPPSRLPPAVPVAEAPPPAARARGIERALERRPELVELAKRRDAARVDGELADNGILPRLDLSLSIAKDLGSDPEASTVEKLDPLDVKAGLMFELPLLLRKGRGKAASSWAKVDKAEAKLRFTEDKVRAQVQDVWSRLMASVNRARVARQGAVVAAAVAAGERVRLREGATSPFVLNLREQAAADAKLVEISARADLQVALTAWRLVTMADALR